MKKSNAAMWATIILILASSLVWAGYTAWATTDPYADNTISNGLLLIQLVYPGVTAVMGVLGGHWTWPRPKPIGPEAWCVGVLIVVLFGQFLFGPALRRVPMPIVFGANYVAGHFLWPQSAVSVKTARVILPFISA